MRQGNQDPTWALYLPYTDTRGIDAAELYTMTGRKALEWQIKLLQNLMGVQDELWVHSRFGFSVPRRNGKNEVILMRELWGLSNGESILHTAHRTTTSHSAWERLCDALDTGGVEYKSIKASGRENIRLPDGGRIEFRTRSPKGGLGEGFDLLVIDEAQEYTPDQQSALKYVVSDSKNPQTIFCGTPPTPISAGTIFTGMRNNVMAGESKNTGWAEWAVENQSDVHDKELWYLTNPSLGTILTERKIEDEIDGDEVDFNIQRLGLWIRYNLKSAISKDEWEALRCIKMPELTGKLYIGIKYGKSGWGSAMSVAVKTAGGKVFVECIGTHPVKDGNDWILAFLQNVKAQTGEVIIDGSSGQAYLAQEMRDARLRKPLLPTVKEVITANAAWEQGIYAHTIQHMGQPGLTKSVTNCEKRAIGSNGGFGYRSIDESVEVELMDSAMLAYWKCMDAKTPVQRVSY